MNGTVMQACLMGAVLMLQMLAAESSALQGTSGEPTHQPTNQTQLSRWSRSPGQGRGMQDHDHEVDKPKSKPWLGYYDFLITEGSYKFWVVFELFTVGLLIYSAFAALYYARYTINNYEDYDDYFFRRSIRAAPSAPQQSLLGLTATTFQFITDAIDKYNREYASS